MKETILTITGIAGTLLASLFGGWDAAFAALCIFMLIDLVTGFILSSVFHKSTKTETGTLESKVMFKGLCRKGVILLLVLIGHRLDIALGFDYIRTAVCISFMANELISIVENAGLMGIPIPKAITNIINVLKKKSESEEK